MPKGPRVNSNQRIQNVFDQVDRLIDAMSPDDTKLEVDLHKYGEHFTIAELTQIKEAYSQYWNSVEIKIWEGSRDHGKSICKLILEV